VSNLVVRRHLTTHFVISVEIDAQPDMPSDK